MTMATWKTKLIRKKARGSQATGKSKGIVASPLAKFMCKHNRLWKHPRYAEVMAKIGLRSKKGV